MLKKISYIILIFVLFLKPYAQSLVADEKEVFLLDSIDKIELINVKADVIEHNGRKGIRVFQKDESVTENGLETLVIISNVLFKDGIIEVELAGEPAPGSPEGSRGFIGIAFRLQKSEPFAYEAIYLRPTNSRAEDQLRRNHSVQYVSHPDHPWHRLRQENSGAYETYVDLLPGRWTKIKIEVKGKQAKLYVHNAKQPTLIVNDLKLGEKEGGIALWLHPSTLAHFRNLIVTNKD
jgi:hypothetical protein